ncbi:MAG TPA: septum site-determining protein MinC, partial [Ramlibacter sp.]|nr:septum site-determining protein MinC [Ramlibacter sp.]
MSVALAGRAPATFEIKSANLPLVSLLLKSADLSLLASELQQRFGDIPDFFDHDPLVLDLTPLQAQPETPLDFAQLLALLRPLRLMPVAARGGSAAQMQAALAAGLAPAQEARVLPLPLPSVAAAPVAAPALAPEGVPVSALVVDRPLRSGQQVYARGRDLVVTAMVNAGA